MSPALLHKWSVSPFERTSHTIPVQLNPSYMQLTGGTKIHQNPFETRMNVELELPCNEIAHMCEIAKV